VLALKAGRYHEDVIANPKWKQQLEDARRDENGIIEKPIIEVVGWSQRWKCNFVEGNMPLSSYNQLLYNK